MKTEIINVNGMSCSHCERAVNEAVGGLSGVCEVSASATDKKVTVTFDEGIANLKEIKEAIEEEGYEIAD